MKIYLVLLLFSFTTSTRCQRVIYKSSEINTPSVVPQLADVYPKILAPDKLVTINQNKEKRIIEGNTVWGYENKNHQIFRYFNNDFFLLKVNAKVCIYFTQRDMDKRREQNYYFSKGLDGMMYRLNSKNAHKILDNNEYESIKKWL